MTDLNVTGWLASGFVATVLLTTILAGSQGLGLTRMNIPYLLGTMVTPDRDRAKVVGIILHLLNGWIFSFVYIVVFHVSGWSTSWLGLAAGVLHAAFVLAVAMPAMPGLHPRMAGETHGPTVVRQLEPPGFLARNYGRRTALSVLLGHVAFGLVLGFLYRPHGL